MLGAIVRRPRNGWLSLFAALLLVVSPATRIRSADDFNESRAAQHAASTPAAGCPESADRVADEILRLRQSVGSAWRGDAIPDSTASADAIEREVVRTALLAQTRPTAEEVPSPRPQSDFGKQAALREAAHQLDITAHALECQDLYPQADDVRAVAQRLRQQARPEPIPTLRHNGTLFTPLTGKPAD